jgi:HAD superfamily hydrolase (TIGR01549 family)
MLWHIVVRFVKYVRFIEYWVFPAARYWSRTMLKVCAFDLGHTLINDSLVTQDSIRAIARWLISQGVLKSEQRFLSTYLDVNTSLKRPFFSHTYGELEYFQTTFTRLRINQEIVTPKTALSKYRQILIERMVLDPETLAGLHYAKAKGFRMAIVSNERVERVEVTMEKFELGPIFDTVVVSEDVGSEKPDLCIFRETLHRLNVAGNEVIMFGDNPIADGACKQLGMIFVLVTVYKNMYRDYDKGESPSPDYVMEKITEKSMQVFLDSVSSR